VALTLNPAALALGRLSGNLELLIAPHQSLGLSPNAIVFPVDRGALASQALGFLTHDSSSVGGELGYHFWFRGRESLNGPWLGPSLLLGRVTGASVGNGASPQVYWGAAVDFGWQAVFPGGFTAGGGLGFGWVELASNAALFPRLLLQVGWSF
jgi:hypothetical protein